MKASLKNILSAHYTSVDDIAQSLDLVIDGDRVMSAVSYTMDDFLWALSVYCKYELEDGSDSKAILNGLKEPSAKVDFLDIIEGANDDEFRSEKGVDIEKFMKDNDVSVNEILRDLKMESENGRIYLTPFVSVKDFEDTLDRYISECMEFGEAINYILSCLCSKHDEAQGIFKEMLFDEE